MKVRKNMVTGVMVFVLVSACLLLSGCLIFST